MKTFVRILNALIIWTLLGVKTFGLGSTIPTYCIDESKVVYNYEGVPSVIGTFINCLKGVGDAMIAPYYDTKMQINVSTEVFLNNLINVDEVSSTVTVDLFFNILWVNCFFLITICSMVTISSFVPISGGPSISHATAVDGSQ